MKVSLSSTQHTISNHCAEYTVPSIKKINDRRVEVSVFCCFAIILLRKRAMVVLLCVHHDVAMWVSVFCVIAPQCCGVVCDCDISWSYSIVF